MKKSHRYQVEPMSQAANSLRKQLIEHYYILTKNAENYIRSPEKQAEAEELLKQINAINTGQTNASAKKEQTLSKFLEAFVATKENPVFNAEYKKKMLADIQAGYSKIKPGVNLENTYQQMLRNGKGGSRRRKTKKTKKTKKTRKSRA